MDWIAKEIGCWRGSPFIRAGARPPEVYLTHRLRALRAEPKVARRSMWSRSPTP
ncbi:MAG: hypothetical protein IPI35_33195 [Deltaproteobacteria bacterium]|nr:hypothetical protein [Deltaproteobacteria bacterium]